MDFNTIMSNSQWGSEAGKVNDNFQKIGTEIDKLWDTTSNLSAGQVTLGTVASLTALNAIVNPAKGDRYIVSDQINPANNLPYYYVWSGSAWVNTGETAFPSDVLTQLDITQQLTDETDTVPSNKAVKERALAVDKKIAEKSTEIDKNLEYQRIKYDNLLGIDISSNILSDTSLIPSPNKRIYNNFVKGVFYKIAYTYAGSSPTKLNSSTQLSDYTAVDKDFISIPQGTNLTNGYVVDYTPTADAQILEIYVPSVWEKELQVQIIEVVRKSDVVDEIDNRLSKIENNSPINSGDDILNFKSSDKNIYFDFTRKKQFFYQGNKCYSCCGDESFYTNPLFVKNAPSQNMPDPTIIKVGEYYYLFTSNNEILQSDILALNIPVCRSKDMLDWEFLHGAFSNNTLTKVHEKYKHMWAPDISYVNGVYILYTVLFNSGTDCEIGIFTTNDITTQFEYKGALFTATDIGIQQPIDPSTTVDDDGTLYMFFGGGYGGYRVKLSADGMSYDKSTLTQVATSTRALEAIMMLKRNNKWYMFTSIDGTDNYYKICVSVGDSLTGEFLNKDGVSNVEAIGDIILQSSSLFYAPGHNSEIVSDKSGNTYTLYHAKKVNDSEPPINQWGNRYLFLQEIKWDENDYPYFDTGKPVQNAEIPNF